MTKRLLLAMLALVAAGYATRGTEEPGERALLLILGGREFPGAESELPFYPGRPNVLEFQLRWDRIDADTVTLKVKKTTPDGREDVLSADVARNGKSFFTLGPLAAPPVYVYEAGEVLYRGYRIEFEIVDAESGATIDRQPFYQGLSKDAVTPERLVEHKESRIRVFHVHEHTPIAMSPERLIAGEMQRQVYNPMYGVEPALAMRLSTKVLEEPDALEVFCRLTPGVTPKLYHQPLRCRLVVRDRAGATRYETELTMKTPGTWSETPIDPSNWPEGDYEIALEPLVDAYQLESGSAWRDGPSLIYRRRLPKENAVSISPVAPWRLERDPAREALEIRDFEDAGRRWSKAVPDGWELERRGPGEVRLVASEGATPTPLDLRLGLTGHYAVFAQPAEEGCLLRVREDGLVRPLTTRHMPYEEPRPESDPPLFVCAAALTGASISIYAFDPWNEPRSGLRSLELVPVTAESVESLYRETSNPPRPLYGVNDWCDYFHGACRLQPDQFDTLVGGQAEVGFRHIDWSIGRSWIEYRSELPGVTYFPAVPLKETEKKWPQAPGYLGRATMINRFRPLEHVLSQRARLGATIWPWLSMNRHYGSAYGGIFASHFFREHPEWHAYSKEGYKLGSTVSYFFPEVRKERVDILFEVARKKPDGLLVGSCRQVPMLRYHPKMVEAYLAETGIDPRKIHDIRDLEAYTKWITWRADHFTQVLRDLKKGLGPIRKETGRPIPVAVRIPSSGLFYNMAEGLDVERWLEENLVDQLQLDPLHERGGEGSLDVRPYVALGKKHGVKVFGGIGDSWTSGGKAHVPALYRARGLLAAGVDGIEIYETNHMARSMPYRWIVPLFGNPQRLEEFLENSNFPACFPVSASNAAFGHDGHSDWHRENRGLPKL